jgi:hypothetical protein
MARRYCAWVEREAEVPVDLLAARRHLAELQLAAIRLPELDSGDNPRIPKPSPELKKEVLNRVATVPFRYYWDTFDPLKENEEPVCGDLADDLADIWLDLWTGLQLFDSGYPVDANFHWRILYDSHWGQHLLDAQRAVYAFLTKSLLESCFVLNTND